MNSFIKANQKLLSYTLIFLIIIPIFGFNFLISFMGNILLLLFLIPIFLLLILFLSFYYFNSTVNKCNQCGAILIGSNICVNCGSELQNYKIKNNENLKKASERTIEVNAEEIK